MKQFCCKKRLRIVARYLFGPNSTLSLYGPCQRV